MGLFDFFKKKRAEPEQIVKRQPEPAAIPEIDFTREVTEKEKEEVAVIVSAILAGKEDDSSWKVKDIRGIDTDKEMAVALVAAVAAQERPDSRFKLHRVTQI